MASRSILKLFCAMYCRCVIKRSFLIATELATYILDVIQEIFRAYGLLILLSDPLETRKEKNMEIFGHNIISTKMLKLLTSFCFAWVQESLGQLKQPVWIYTGKIFSSFKGQQGGKVESHFCTFYKGVCQIFSRSLYESTNAGS